MPHGARSPLLATLPLLALGLAGCISASNPVSEAGLGALPPVALPLGFAGEVLIDPGHRGGEPSIVVDASNHYYVSAPSGLVTSVFNPVFAPGSAVAMGPHNRQSFVWKSEDQGATWQLLSMTPPPLPPLRGDPTFGGGDTDLAVDACDTVYFTDLWLGNIAVSHSKDHGATWMGVPVTGLQAPLDRQWLAATDCDELYMAYQTFNSEVYVIRSTDAGMTFPQQVLVTTDYGIIGNLVADKASGALYIVLATMDGSGVQVFSSHDEGQTWEHHAVHQGSSNVINIFPAMDVDRAGNLYVVWSEHAAGSFNVYLSTSTDHGMTWSAPRAVSGPEDQGTEVFPWVAAGDAGRAAVVWYGAPDTVATTDEVQGDWFVFMAASEDALAPQGAWSLAQASATPMHQGEICTRGLFCTVPPPGQERGNRNLADFFEVAVDLEGRAVITWANDYETGDQLVSLPYFTRQAQGPVLLAMPAPAEEPAAGR